MCETLACSTKPCIAQVLSMTTRAGKTPEGTFSSPGLSVPRPERILDLPPMSTTSQSQKARAPSPKPLGRPAILLAIGELAEATGVPSETIRIWERRYGKPEPIRLPSGHRRYDESHVRWLRRMSEGVSRGHRPSQLARLSESELDRLIDPVPTTLRQDPEIAALFAMIQEYRDLDLRATLLDAGRRLPAATFLRERAVPLVRSVTCWWAEGRFGVRHEHLLSECLQDVLRTLRLECATPTQKRRLMMTTLPEDQHDLGLHMAALLASRHRLPTTILGRDLPEAELLRAIEEVQPFGVCLTLSNLVGTALLERRLSELRAIVPPHVTILVGGSSLRTLKHPIQGVNHFASFDDFDRHLAILAGTN